MMSMCVEERREDGATDGRMDGRMGWTRKLSISIFDGKPLCVALSLCPHILVALIRFGRRLVVGHSQMQGTIHSTAIRTIIVNFCE